jgi:glycolate oxidase iron-sulfur subunit
VQTRLDQRVLATPEGREADAILRSCVHCGFCTATCPTYQLLGDELDGPRGRIYLIKEALEGGAVTERTQRHLDRCLTCRACETACPSGVRYGRLVEIGRAAVDARVPRGRIDALKRVLLRAVVPWPRRFGPLLRIGQLLRPLAPPSLRRRIPRAQAAGARPHTEHPRRMLVLEGCVQSVATPRTNAAASRVFDRLGIALESVPAAGCCGAVSLHLSAPDEARDFMRRNIDAWWPRVDAGAEAIVMTASACGAMVKDYGGLLRDDPGYADKAARISALARDVGEVLHDEDLSVLMPRAKGGRRVAFHSPCTLQHGQKLADVVESVLERAGHTLTVVPDAHLCCGSAGAYSLLQPELSAQLLRNKLAALEGGRPDVIASANIGCQLHLATAAGVPVRHWVELLDEG